MLDSILAWSQNKSLGISDLRWLDGLSNFFTKSFRIKDLMSTILLDNISSICYYIHMMKLILYGTILWVICSIYFTVGTF